MRGMFVRGKRRWWALAGLGLTVVVCTVAVVGFNLAGGRVAHASGSGDGESYCSQQWDGTPACHVKGFIGNAAYSGTDTTTCAAGIYSRISIYAAETLSHSLPGAATDTPYASIGIMQYNSCTSQFMQYYGYTTTADLQVTGRIDGAVLHAVIPTMDYWSGQEGPTITVDATWKGIGDVAKLTTTRDYRNGDIMTKMRMTGDDRMALTNGTVSDGTTTYTISGMSEISYAQVGELVISHT